MKDRVRVISVTKLNNEYEVTTLAALGPADDCPIIHFGDHLRDIEAKTYSFRIDFLAGLQETKQFEKLMLIQI